MNQSIEANERRSGRVIGLDLHPRVFSAAALRGRDAFAAQVEQRWDRWPTEALARWARQLQRGDVVVLEATGPAFEAVRRLREHGVVAVVLETQRAGQIRSSYCTNDRTDAVKLGRIYLSGLARLVWEPDAQTRERREILHRYLRSVADATRARNQLTEFLCSRGERVPPHTRLTQPSGRARVLQLQPWSPCQQLLLHQMLDELAAADRRRRDLSALMAQEVAADRSLLSLLRVLGVRHIIAFAIGAVVGDIARFANPKKLVAYLGLTPRLEISGEQTRGPEGLPSYGRRDLRTLLVQAAHVALRQKSHPLHSWAWKLCLRKAHKNVAVAAVARKLTVSIWYCLRGLFEPLSKSNPCLERKLARLGTALGRNAIKRLGCESRAAFVTQNLAILAAPA